MEENGENHFVSRGEQRFENFYEEIEQHIGKLICEKNNKEGDTLQKL